MNLTETPLSQEYKYKGRIINLRVDEARLGEQDVGPLLVALSPTPVSDGGGYRALVGPLDGKDGA